MRLYSNTKISARFHIRWKIRILWILRNDKRCLQRTKKVGRRYFRCLTAEKDRIGVENNHAHRSDVKANIYTKKRSKEKLYRCNVAFVWWNMWSMNGVSIDRSIDRSMASKNTQEAVRNAVGTDLSKQLSISLHVERYERVKGKKHVKAIAIGIVERIPVLEQLEDGSNTVQSRCQPRAHVIRSESREAGNFSCGFVVHRSVSISDTLRRSHLKSANFQNGVSRWHWFTKSVEVYALSRENCQSILVHCFKRSLWSFTAVPLTHDRRLRCDRRLFDILRIIDRFDLASILLPIPR